MIAGIAAALLTGGCEFILGPNEPVGGGNLAIAFGESGDRAAAPADLERYDVVLTGPKEQKITVSFAPEETVYQEVALGEWHLDAKAYKAGNVLIGTGSITVTVKPGRNEVRIPMRVVPPEFIAVSGITGVPASGTAGKSITLTGTVSPANATNQAIVWSVKTPGGTGASITGNSLSTTNTGSVIVTATIADGTAAGTDYTQDFNITINPSPGSQLTRTINSVNVPFRYVPAGSFQRDSGPANISIITRGYWMGETEVTQELFQAVMGINPSSFTSGPDAGETQNRRPVENVNWYDAIAFCNKLSLADGKEPVYSVSGVGLSDWNTVTIPTSDDAAWNAATMDTTKNGYRLPTEMEWMWAAIGADKTVQPNTTGYTKAFAGSTGSNNVDDYAWHIGNSGSKTHEVGKRTANELGLKDMSGNVHEWCWDRYSSYPTGEQMDYAGTASSPRRVHRGGSWHTNVAPYCTVANRDFAFPYQWDNFLGFRVVSP
jgi:formylglycine-generating enzyme required for sulfatase activity